MIIYITYITSTNTYKIDIHKYPARYGGVEALFSRHSRTKLRMMRNAGRGPGSFGCTEKMVSELSGRKITSEFHRIYVKLKSRFVKNMNHLIFRAEST